MVGLPLGIQPFPRVASHIAKLRRHDHGGITPAHAWLQQLRNVVKGAVRSEHQTMVNMVVLLLKQVFEEAQEQGAALEMDMHAIEDAK